MLFVIVFEKIVCDMYLVMLNDTILLWSVHGDG